MWISVATLAFIFQLAVGVPSFGNGPQLEAWNEIDNEFPGEMPERDVIPLEWQDKLRLQKVDLEDDLHLQGHERTSAVPESESEEVALKAIEQLAAPTPTPRPPTEQDMEDSLPPTSKSADSLLFEDQQSVSGYGNLITNEIHKTSLSSPLQSENEKIIEALENSNPIENSPSSFLQIEGHNNQLAEIMKEITLITGSLSQSEKDELFQSMSKLLLRRNDDSDTSEKAEDLHKTFARIVLRISAPSPTGASRPPCGEEGSSSQEGSSQEELPQVRISQDQNIPVTKVPNIKGVLLKSLVPKEYLVVKDLYDIMKARAAANAAGDSGEKSFNPTLFFDPFDRNTKNPFGTSSRYVAFAPKDRNMLPPKYFPDLPDQEPQIERRDSDIPFVTVPLRTHIPVDGLGRQFPIMFRQPQATSFSRTSDIGLYNNQQSFADQDFDPDMKSVINRLLTKLADQSPESSALKNFHMAALREITPVEEEDPRAYIPIHYRRRQMNISFNK